MIILAQRNLLLYVDEFGITKIGKHIAVPLWPNALDSLCKFGLDYISTEANQLQDLCT